MIRASERNLRWFAEARLGLFIHWVAYGALREGERLGPVPLKDYRHLLDRFTLSAFDADAFVRKARERGFSYIVPTAHHADGLCLWDTATSDFKTTLGPARRDVLRELADACRKHGLRLGVYLPYCDQAHPLMQPLFAIGKQDAAGWGTNPPLPPADVQRFRAHLEAQVRELCTRYGELAMLWWDAGPPDPVWSGRIKGLVNALQPGILQNTRWTENARQVSRRWTRMPGDFFTPENVVPSIPVTHGGRTVPWHTCLTTIDNWLCDWTDHNYKSGRTLIRTFAAIASQGGGLLLNVAPDGEGRVPAEIEEALDTLGDWLARHREALRGTAAGPRHDIPEVALTRRGRSLYVHYMGTERGLELPAFGPRCVGAATVPNDSPVPVRARSGRLILDLSGVSPDPDCTVIRLDFAGRPHRVAVAAPFPARDVAEALRTRPGTPRAVDWRRARWVWVTAESGRSMLKRQPSPGELSFAFAALHDGQSLHVRVDVTCGAAERPGNAERRPADHFAEQAGAKENEPLVRQSSVELYFDALPPSWEVTADGRCFQVIVGASGRSTVAFAPDGRVPYRARVRRRRTGYTVFCEVPLRALVRDPGRRPAEYLLDNYFALPRQDLPVSRRARAVAPGDVIGLNVSVNEPAADGVGRLIHKLWWQARSHCPFNDPQQWGRLRVAR